jgi:hypothetical protein
MINNNEQTKTGDNLTNHFVAYCGIDCTVGPPYQNDCTEGSLGSNPANACGACAVRRCSLEKQISLCAYVRNIHVQYWKSNMTV